MACTSWVLLCCPKHVEGPGIDPPTPGLADTPLFPLCRSDYNESNDSTHETAPIDLNGGKHALKCICLWPARSDLLLTPFTVWDSPTTKNTAGQFKTKSDLLNTTQFSSYACPPCETVQVNKCRWFVCVCVFCFGPPAFFSVYALPFPSSLTAQYTPLLPKTPSIPRSLPLLWFCRSSHDQARYPSNYLALSNKATTDSNEEWNIKDRHCLCSHYLSAQETERRSESSGTCREATTTFSLPFLDKYHQWEQQSQTCPGSLVTAYLFV